MELKEHPLQINLKEFMLRHSCDSEFIREEFRQALLLPSGSRETSLRYAVIRKSGLRHTGLHH
jgi:hypothetical protein